MAQAHVDIVREAIAIQGYVIVSVAGRDRQARTVAVGDDGSWITDILVANLDGYVRIRKTRAALVAQAKYIIANRESISAARAAREAAATARMMN